MPLWVEKEKDLLKRQRRIKRKNSYLILKKYNSIIKEEESSLSPIFLSLKHETWHVGDTCNLINVIRFFFC